MRATIKEVITSGLVIALSAALLWHFSNIWREGQHLILEPNRVILSLETGGLVVIFGFGVAIFVAALKQKNT